MYCSIVYYRGKAGRTFRFVLERANFRDVSEISQYINIHIMFGDLGGFGEGIGIVLNTDRSSPPSLGVNLVTGC